MFAVAFHYLLVESMEILVAMHYATMQLSCTRSASAPSSPEL